MPTPPTARTLFVTDVHLVTRDCQAELLASLLRRVRPERRVGAARRYVAQFEQAALHQAARGGLDGYVGGHIHKAGFRARDGVLYCNDGDWVEHCTALLETPDGRLQL